jgi:hypothetical protein
MPWQGQRRTRRSTLPASAESPQREARLSYRPGNPAPILLANWPQRMFEPGANWPQRMFEPAGWGGDPGSNPGGGTEKSCKWAGWGSGFVAAAMGRRCRFVSARAGNSAANGRVFGAWLAEPSSPKPRLGQACKSRVFMGCAAFRSGHVAAFETDYGLESNLTNIRGRPVTTAAWRARRGLRIDG